MSRMAMQVLAATLALLGAGTARAQDVPVLTLEQAVDRAREVDPALVAAHGAIDVAGWARRGAKASLFLPSVAVSADATTFSSRAMNLGTLQPADRVVTSHLQASYDVFLGGRKLAAVRRASTAVTRAVAAEREAEFSLRRAVAADYYGALAARELHAAAVERVSRAREQLAVARARVALGAAVPTDSLQVTLELTRARVEELQRRAALGVARLQLGRRVGAATPVDPAAHDSARPPRTLPLSQDAVLNRALAFGPAFVAARAGEHAAIAAVAAERAAYLPRITLTGVMGGYGERFFPRDAYRSQVTAAVTLPLWDNGVRESAFAAARAEQQAARARRLDLERGAAQAVAAAYTTYTTANASVDLAETALAVAREVFRVQEARYRAGATTVLDLLDSQSALTRAQTELVVARQRAHLALADLETIIGQRLTPPEETK